MLNEKKQGLDQYRGFENYKEIIVFHDDDFVANEVTTNPRNQLLIKDIKAT